MQSAIAENIVFSSRLFLDITSIDSETIIAVGERGSIAKKNINQDWQLIESPTDLTLTAVYSDNPTSVWAVGHQGIILHSLDGGNSWQVSFKADVNSPFMDILFFNSNQGIAVGAYGLFYRTTDAGQTWQKEVHAGILSEDDQIYLEEVKQDSPDMYQEEVSALQPHLNRLAQLDAKRLILVGELGLLALSQDNGKSWDRMKDVYIGSFFGVEAEQEVILTGLRGHVFTSTSENLDNWQAISVSEPVNINSAIYLDNSRWLLVGNSQTLWLWHAKQKAALPVGKVTHKAILNGAILGELIWLVGAQGIEAIAKPSIQG